MAVTLATSLDASLLSVLHTREIVVDRIIAKSKGPDHTTILKRMGVQEIISPEEDVAEQLAREIGNPKILEHLQLKDGHGIVEMFVPEFFCGKSLKELQLRQEYGIQVLGVKKAKDSEADFVSAPDEPFDENDVVWITGPRDTLNDISGN